MASLKLHLMTFLSSLTRPSSVFETLNMLTASTWILSRETLEQWLSSSQRRALFPYSNHSYRLHILIYYFAFMSFRYALYLAMWSSHRPEIGIQGDVVHLGFPYYYGEVYQMLTAFSLYVDGSAGGVTFFAWFIYSRFPLDNYLPKQTKRLKWYRAVVAIDAITRVNHRTSLKLLKMLRHVTAGQYRKYRRRFCIVLQLQTMCLKNNNVITVLFFLVIMQYVVSHPEWNYPVLPLIAISFTYQIWYYYVFRVFVAVQIMLYLKSALEVMLLDSVSDRLKRNKTFSRVRHTCSLFDEALRLVGDINAFWRHQLGNYYLLFIPSNMSAVYVMLFVPTERVFKLVMWYFVITALLLMHFNNWTAAAVRVSAAQIYRLLYHRKIIMAHYLNIATKFKVINATQLIISKSCRFGIRIGVLGTANRRVTFIILMAMARVFMFSLKLARNIDDSLEESSFHESINP